MPVSVRAHEVTRLEGFSDAVFGFALTLLVVKLEAPKNDAELMQLVRGSAPFALTFTMVCYIWWEHNKFFRRYGLQDAWTAFLNSVLLFVVLFYVYPLKYLTTNLVGPSFGALERPEISSGRFVMIVYSTGVVLIFAVFLLLYRHAWKKRDVLQLSPADEVSLRYGGRAHFISMAIAIASLTIALASDEGPRIMLAGFIYSFMGPLHAWNGVRHGRARQKVVA